MYLLVSERAFIVGRMDQVTRIFSAIDAGDTAAADELLPLVYNELRRLAAKKLACEPPSPTLQPTMLVHEAYMRLIGDDLGRDWKNRGYFFAAAAEAMRRILVERARKRKRRLSGGDGSENEPADLDLFSSSASDDDDQILDLNEALDELADKDAKIAEVVKLRYFAGLTIRQAADAAGISHRTANRHWAYAKAWLYRRLK